MKRVLALVSLSLFLAGTNVMAQQNQTQDVTTYKFSDNLVEGDLIAPGGDIVTTRTPGRERSLIRIRTQFVDALLKSVENL